MKRAAQLAFAAATVAACGLRFWAPATRPLHHDEAVNFLFLRQLLDEGILRYDPTNYHGPALYAFAAPLVGMFGPGELWLRFVPALASLLTVALVWRLRGLIGTWGAVAAAWIVALSPCAVFFARDYIHESLLALFLLGFLAYVADYVAQPDRGRLVLAAICLALAFATKETTPITLIAFAAGAGLAALDPEGRAVWRRVTTALLADRQGLLVAAGVGAVVLALFMSSLGTNPRGLVDFVRAYLYWTKTGVEGVSGHEKPFLYFVSLFAGPDRVAGVLGLAGVLYALARPRARGLYLVGWTLVSFLVYSAVPYKTPWVAINLVLPLAAAAGLLFEEARAAARTPALRVLLVLGLVAPLAVAGREAVSVSFERFDDDSIPYVYSQTRRGFFDLVRAVQGVAVASARRDLDVAVLSPDYFPLNYYTRNLDNVAYWGKVEAHPGASLILVKKSDIEQLKPLLDAAYMTRTFPLRPGVDLTLLVRSDLHQRAAAALEGEWAELPAAVAPAVPAHSAD